MVIKSYKNSKRKSTRSRSKKTRKTKRGSLKNFCRSKLSNKIKINMKEYKQGNKKIKSVLQAIAIAYSQINKKYPKCSRSLKKKSKK